MKRIPVLVTLTALVALWTMAAFAAVPQLINFQGILRDGGGNPVANGSYSVTFTIYDSSTVPPGIASSVTADVLWTETQSVTTNSGLFNVLLGSVTPIPDSAFNDSSRYLGIKVGADPEMTPWLRLSSVGYSYNSAEWTSGIGSPFLVKGNAAVSPYEILYRLNGNVGIGTSNPLAKLDVLNTGSDAFDIKAIQGQVENASSGNAYAGYFAASSAGTGNHYGVFARAFGSSSYGVYGEGIAYGVYAHSNDGYGVRGNSNTWVGGKFNGGWHGVDATGGNHGVAANATEAGGVGVYGEALNTGGYGVYGDGGSYGVYGTTTSGTGVYASSSSGPGVVASGGTNGVEATGTSRGVYATGGSYGVVGATSGSGGAGIYGSRLGNPGTWSGYFDGDVFVGEDLLVIGGKSAAVKTDNGEYHLLYAQESPENWFEDFGTARLVNGRAIVTIDPLYAQTVNTSVAYHVFLTPEGDCRGLFVTSKSPASFEIRELQNGKSDLSVSYRIVAKRKGYENVRLAKMTGKTPEEMQAEAAKLQAEQASVRAREEQARKQMEAERAKMQQERGRQEQKK